MERETILFDVVDHVATITLNRPDNLNSFNEAMANDMSWAWETPWPLSADCTSRSTRPGEESESAR